jgi:hypothetical protein
MARMRTADGSYVHVPAIIDNPAAYERATKARIIANANKTFCNTYADHAEIEAFLSTGVEVDDYDRKTFKDNFAGSLASAYANYGKLTEKQVEAVRKCIIKNNERREAFTKAVEEQKARSVHLGVANERMEFKLHVDKIVEVEVQKFSYYDSSTMRIYLMRDEAGNRVVYKTKTNWHLSPADGIAVFVEEKSDITVKATVKAHADYKGEKQTIIQRAKVTSIAHKD